MTLKRIAMLSTHGYFDPEPELGRTDTGGQVVYVLKLAEALTKLGIQVDIFTRWFDQEKPQIEQLPDCPDARVIRIRAGDWEFIPKEHLYPLLPELTENMIEFINEQALEYDLFHGHYVDAGIVTLEVAKNYNKPSFFTCHSLGAWKRERMGGDPVHMERQFNFKHREAEELRIFNEVNAQTVTTQLQEDKINELYDFTSDNISVIAPGVDIDVYTPQDTRLPDLPQKFIFCLSRFDTNKGNDLLLNAFNIVRKTLPDTHLLICGGADKLVDRELQVIKMMEDIVSSKGMKDSVTIKTGTIPMDVKINYYSSADLFVLPSKFEPFGMTAIEAMACDTPVVASKFGGIKDVIIDGENGLLADVADPVDFADKMIEVLKDKEKAAALSTAGRKMVLGQYSWQAIAEQHIDFYDKFM